MDRQTSAPVTTTDKAYEQKLRNEPESGRFDAPRGWWDRTSDEVASWFGNTDAMRRRQRDEAVGDHTGQGPKNSVDPDAVILDQVSHHFTEDAVLDASRIEVACHAGVVTLKGEVTTLADKNRAEHLAAATPGVVEVKDGLVVA